MGSINPIICICVKHFVAIDVWCLSVSVTNHFPVSQPGSTYHYKPFFNNTKLQCYILLFINELLVGYMHTYVQVVAITSKHIKKKLLHTYILWVLAEVEWVETKSNSLMVPVW